jgi:hypothetical protein
MTIKTLTASSLIIGAALMSAQSWAQQMATPTEPATAAPAQPATTAVPASAPAPATGDPVTTAQPAPDPSDPVNQPAPVDQAQTTPAPTSPTQPAPAQQAQAAPAAGASPVIAFVDQQFPQADANGDGSLSPTEFEPWIAKFKAAELQSAGKPVVAAEVKTYASNAFATADKDANKLVSKVELTQFLSPA